MLGRRPDTPTGSPAVLSRARIIAGIALVALLAGVYGVLSWTGALATILDGPVLQDLIVRLGLLGPLAAGSKK